MAVNKGDVYERLSTGRKFRVQGVFSLEGRSYVRYEPAKLDPKTSCRSQRRSLPLNEFRLEFTKMRTS